MTDHSIVLSALIDFCAYLTTQRETITLGASWPCPILVEYLKKWCEEKGIDSNKYETEWFKHIGKPSQIDKLANYLIKNYSKDIAITNGAGDVAIKLLEELREKRHPSKLDFVLNVNEEKRD